GNGARVPHPGKAAGGLPAADRPAAGARINEAKATLEPALERRRAELADAKLAKALAADALDVSLPGRGLGTGGLHPVTRTVQRIEKLFRSMGFAVAHRPRVQGGFPHVPAPHTPAD